MKKCVVALLVVASAVLICNNTGVGKEIKKACSHLVLAVKNWVNPPDVPKKPISLEAEIKRIRHQIAKLEDDKRAQISPLAEEMASVETLKQEIEDTRKTLTTAKANILAMTRDLKSKKDYVSVGDEEYTAEDARAKLTKDFANYKNTKAELKSKEQLLAAKEKSVAAVLKQMDSLKGLKRDLELRLAQLEAELKTVRLAQMRDKYQMDDSRLSKIKQALNKIERRLKVERKVLELNHRFTSEPTPVRKKKAKPEADVTAEVDKYFNEKT
jgi:chromosome segregation ATPase